MKKLFTLLILMLFWAGNSYPQSIPTSLSNIPEKVTHSNAHPDPLPPVPLGPLTGGETIGTATVIGSLPYNDSGNTTSFVDNYNEVCPYTATGGRDVVYSYTPTANGAIDVTLCNDATAYDTKLYIYDTPTPVTGDAIACNDDYCSTVAYPYAYVSEVLSVPVTSGTTYYIVVDGYSSSDYGAYAITVTGGVIYPVPPNDDCTGATVVAGPFPQTVTGTTLGATVDCPSDLGWNAVWYAVSLPYAVNDLTVDWCGTANMGTVGVVYYETCPVVCANYILYTSNTWQTCGTPAGALTALTSFLAIPGPATIYYPAYSVPQMDHVLTFNVTEVITPACGNTNLGLLSPTTTPQLSAYAAGDTYYWTFNALANMVYTFSTCGSGEDTYLRIYDAGLVEIASNNDNGPYCTTTEASLNFTPTAAGLYYVSLAGNPCNNLVNAGNLQYYYTIPPPACGNTNLGLLSPTTTPQLSAYTAGDTYYWSFNALANMLYTFNSCGSGEDTYLRIYNASLVEIAANNDNGPQCTGTEASLDWLATAPALYYVSLAGNPCNNLVNGGNLEYYYTPTGPGCGNTNLGLLTLTTTPQTYICPAGSTYYWSFNANANDTYTFSACGGVSEDTYIRIYDASFAQIAYNDDYGPYCASTNASLDWTAIASGLYYVSFAHFSCSNLVNPGNFEYYYTPAPVCPAPTALNATNVTAHTANLTWTPGLETQWEYSYGLSPWPIPGGAGTVTTSSTVNPISGLTESTAYQYWVRAFCNPDFSDWSGPYTFNTPASCLAPTGLSVGNIQLTSADVSWLAGGSESSWNVQVGPPGFIPGTGAETVGVVATTNNPWTATPLTPGTSYDAYTQANCGFDQPKRENFWIQLYENGEIGALSGGAPVDDPGEDGVFYFYQDWGVPWHNVWWYNGQLDMTRMKIIRMGFWVQRINQDAPADITYVVNWSTSDWGGTGFPTPAPTDTAYIDRSPMSAPVEVLPSLPGEFGQWVELYYVIPDFNPEWVSVDLWGQNVQIVYELTPPPMESPLYSWWMQDPQRGGILLHECLPKPVGDASTWTGPVTFSTTCLTTNLPVCESYPTADWPACWTEQFTGTITSSHWSAVNSNFAGGVAYEAEANYSPGQGSTQADNDRMVSPPFNTTGLSSIHLSFRQMLNDFNAGVNDVWVKVQSSSDGVNWTDEWVYPGGLGVSIPAEVKQLDITNNLGGTTWIAWTLSGFTYDINYWYVDDICITAPCLTNTWTGAAGNAWNAPGNWSCGMLPDATMSVIVPSGLTTYPEIPVGVTAECFDINVEIGAHISVFGTLNVVNP